MPSYLILAAGFLLGILAYHAATEECSMSTPSIVERVADILDEHRTTTRDGMGNVCACGWGDVTTWGRRQSVHVAAVLSGDGLLTDNALPPIGGKKRKREPLGPIVRFINWIAWPQRDRP